jgi:ABC-type uncharacterized transport system involved in gliding motility auxiliary subunit
MVNQWFKNLWLILLVLLWILWGLCFITLAEYKALIISYGVFNLTLTFLFILPHRKNLLEGVKRHFVQRFIAEGISFILILAILGLINFLSLRFNFIRDISSDGLNTLSDQSVQVLKSIQSPMKVTLFAEKAAWSQTLPFLKLFSYENPLIKVKAVDLEAEPSLARSLGINQSGQILLEYEKARHIFLLQDELSLLNGFLKVMNQKKTKVYLTQGHGEIDCAATTPQGGSHVCDQLKTAFSEVAGLNLITTDKMPEDADVVLILNPQNDFLNPEMMRLQSYLEKGGSLLLGYSPLLKAGKLPALSDLVKKWGIEITHHLIIDQASSMNGQEATIPVVDQYHSRHPLMKKFTARTFYPVASPLKVVDPLYQNVAVHELVETSAFPGSWGETNLKKIEVGRVEFDPEDDKGPLIIVAVAERLSDQIESHDTRVAVVGSGLLFTNAYAPLAGNTDFILNLSHWLNHAEGLISLNRPQTKNSPIVLSALHLHAIFYLAVITIPLIFIVSAITVYWRRKRC